MVEEAITCKSVTYLIASLPPSYRPLYNRVTNREKLLKVIARCFATPTSLITAVRILDHVTEHKLGELVGWRQHLARSEWGFERFSERWGKEEEARLLLGAALKIAGCWWDDFLPEIHSIWTRTYKAARNPNALAYTERRLLHWLDYRLHRFGHPPTIAYEARTHGIGNGPCRLGAMVTEIDLETVKSGRTIVTPLMMDTLVKDHRNCGVDRVTAKLQSRGWK